MNLVWHQILQELAQEGLALPLLPTAAAFQRLPLPFGPACSSTGLPASHAKKLLLSLVILALLKKHSDQL